jgi:o-succinylbenzoate---CoA ligase
MNFIEVNSKIKRNYSPQNPAIITSTTTITYSDLQKIAVETAASLNELGINKGDYVSIISENNKDFVIIVLSLWLIDAIPIPINIKLNTEEIEKLISISGSRKLLLHKNLKNKFEFNQQLIFPFQAPGKSDFSINSFNDENKTAVVIFTSGSTGIPKGVMLSFRNLIRSAEIGDKILNHSTNDRWLASLPFYHIGGFSIISRTLLAGASMIIPDSSDIKDFINSINNFKPTLASFVGVQLKKLLDDKTTVYSEFKNILIGGGFTNDDLINSAINNGCKISKVYGSSEVASFVTALTFEEIKRKVNSSGKPISPNDIFIVNEAKEILPPNTIGEIVVKSDAVFTGYLNNKAETQNKLINGLYFTGDIGYIDEEGFLFVQARRSDLIVTGGENVNPLEVENCILQVNNIEDCCVIGIEDKTWGHIVAAAIVCSDNILTEEDIQNFLRSKLAGFKIPKKILLLSHLPRTLLGKIEKEKISELFRND